jgi:hypothetical protein
MVCHSTACWVTWGCEARRCAQVGDLVVKPWADCAGQQHEGAIGDGDDGDRVAA